MGGISAGSPHPAGASVGSLLPRTPIPGPDRSLGPARGIVFALAFGAAGWGAILGAVELLRALL